LAFQSSIWTVISQDCAARFHSFITSPNSINMPDPVGEDGWLALVDEASRTAGDLEQRVGVVELYKRAIAAEPWSIKLWMAYCEWVWSLYTDCQNGDAGWPEEEQLLGQELFSLETALDVWQQGAQAIQYRLNDSHELWNRWLSIELDQLADPPDPKALERLRTLFLERLQTPHANREETSQMFSGFLSRYDESVYESTMIQVTRLTKEARDLYEHREMHELKLNAVLNTGDSEAIKQEMKNYLDWEHGQALRKTKKGAPATPLMLCVALYERALCSTSLGTDADVWLDYIIFLADTKANEPDANFPPLLPVIQRATNHCPWSGTLWARYILCAESEQLPFSTMEQIKHAATNTRELDRDGMAAVVEFYIAWSGYLKRLAMIDGASDENVDVADMGLPTALEDVQQWGKRLHRDQWKGDPSFRIERLMIQHLTEKDNIDQARQIWRKLVRTHEESYEFWEQYYLWEMTVRHTAGSSSFATSVLFQAVKTRGMDWPEKILEIYIRHCQTYEDVDTLLKAMSYVRRATKGVARRREAEAAALYAQQHRMEVDAEVQPTVLIETESPSSAKRKRESEEVDGAAKKKMKSIDQDALREQHLKRDRENTTVLVTNLPPEVTQTKVRQYFKEYGHINSLALKTGNDMLSCTALIEFRSPEDVQSALLRDGKYFAERRIQVIAGTGLTLFVTNFPPTADEAYLHKIFEDCGEIISIRWPSLKANAHRRFCYISFKTPESAAAATQLDGKSLGGVYKLSAKYSDPANKKGREGATAEGREIHITGLDFTVKDDELREIFGKYGKVVRVNVLKKANGDSKGAAFISFEKKESATASLELDKTRLKSCILNVELSIGKNFKPIAGSTGKAGSASPAPNGSPAAMSPSPMPESHINTHAFQGPSRTETTNRTMTLMNIPDTVNDARIRAIVEPYGEIVKLVVRHDHQGAIIEYADAASAGRAALSLENHEIVPGRKLRTGGLKDLFAQKEEIKTDKIQIGKGKQPAPAFMQPNVPIRRPGAGGRGGLGQKRGLGYSAGKAAPSVSGSSDSGMNGNHEENSKKPKSNADFKAMFVKGGQTG
jgi:RNA recognition motif-containing protein